ncbi:MAG: hypothetical protein U1E45_00565 [Geminicoccaceae bacterium]
MGHPRAAEHRHYITDTDYEIGAVPATDSRTLVVVKLGTENGSATADEIMSAPDLDAMRRG